MAESQWWVPHEYKVFVPGRLLKEEGDTSTYITDDGEVSVPSKQQLEEVGDSKALVGVNDICTLENITSAALLHSVRVRYQRDEIYTNISRILVAVNPFKPLSIYEDQYVENYHYANDPASQPPHIFGVGADVCQRLVQDSTSQAVLISGESGAGKTESAKLVLLYISQAFSNDGGGDGFEDRILEINPILEAFGNAKTGRNNNSSRFGKWIEVNVDPSSMNLRGASVTDYLLEVTRVCGQGPGERNYHIFYQLVGDKSGDLDELKLSGGVEGFEYLKANSAEIQGLDDAENFNMLRKAFAGLRFTKLEQDAIFRIIAGILHLGNLAFTKSDDSTKVANESTLADAAALLGCEASALDSCVCKKRLVVGKDVSLSPLGDAAAHRARDSIAKLIYSRLFKWLIERCNRAFASNIGNLKAEPEGKASTEGFPFVGVLDIAGFESFESNSLEQLFINLSNEKLQQFFNSSVFKTELQVYKEEDIKFDSINFADNADILALIEGKGGLLPMLDDSTTGIQQTDAKYTTQVTKAHEKHGCFIKSKFPNKPLFGVRHFAGDVNYTTIGFLEKNVAQQPLEVLEMMANSKLPVLQELAADPEAEKAGGARGAKKATVGSAFRKSLQQLVDKFGCAGPHFIRCVKPNTHKVPNMFQADMVCEQLRLSGVMEAVKIRKQGFPVRQLLEEFVKRYFVLVSSDLREKLRAGLRSGAAAAAAKELLEALTQILAVQVQVTDFAIGKTKVFMRDGFYRMLEKYRRVALAGPALCIQQHYRGYHLRVVLKESIEVMSDMQKMVESMGMLTGKELKVKKQQRATAMEDSLGKLDILLSRAEHLPVKLPSLSRMLKIRVRIATEANLMRQMQNQMIAKSVDLPEMKALLARAADHNMTGSVVTEMQERCDKLREQLPMIRALKGYAELDLEAVQKVITTAKEQGFDNADKWIDPQGFSLYEDAFARLQQLEEEKRKAEEEEKRKAEAEAAAARAAREAREAAAKQAAMMAAKRAQDKLKVQITKAVAEMDAPALQEVLSEAEDIGMPEEDLAEAHQLFLNLQSGDFVQSQLTRLRRKSSEDPLELLQKSNLIKQIEALGLKVLPLSEEMREVTNQLIAKQKTKTFDAEDPVMAKVAERCFEDLANYSGLRDPQSWGGKGWRMMDLWDFLEDGKGKASPALAMLQWSAERLPETLTVLDASVAALALRNFSNLLRCMGDKPAAYIGNKEDPIISLAKRSPVLRDEIYVQIMKQLTANPSAESAKKGWHLFKNLCSTVSPSAEMSEFVKAFLQKAQRGELLPATLEKQEHQKLIKRKSSAFLAEKNRKSCGVIMESFLAEQPKSAEDALKAFEAITKEEEAPAQTSCQSQLLVEVYTEDGQSRSLKYKDNWTLEDLHHRMLKVMSMQSVDGFEFFAFDLNEEGMPWRILSPKLGVAATAAKEATAGRFLLFGRINLSRSEDLPVHDFARARLSFQHAVKQWLGYSLDMPQNEALDISVKIAVSLVAVDKILYAKKKRGKAAERFNAKLSQFKRELEAGLVETGVLERYVPPDFLKKADRATIAKQVVELLQQRAGMNEDGNFELLGKSRALAVMQAKLPDFQAYRFSPVTPVPFGEIKLEEVEWDSAPPLKPKQGFGVLEARVNSEHHLLVSHEGIQLQATRAADWSLSIPLRSCGGRWFLTGWGIYQGEMLVFSLLDRCNAAYEPSGIVIKTAEGVAKAASTFLNCFNA